MSNRLKQFFGKFDWKLPLHKNLDALQVMLEKQSIDPASPQGLAAYELVCKQYLHTNTAASSSQSLASQVKTNRQGIEKKVSLTPFSIREADLNKLIRKRRVRQFFSFLRVLRVKGEGKEQRNRRRLNRQAAEYFYRIKTASKFMNNLKQYSNQYKILNENVSTYIKMKKQALLEQCFLEWKEQALITQAQRQFRYEIEKKYVILSKVILLRRLTANLSSSAERKQLIQQQQNRLRQSMKIASSKLLFNRLKIWNSTKQAYSNKNNEVNKSRENLFFKQLMRTTKKFIINRQNKEQQRIKRLKSYVFPRSFFKKLKTSYQIRKVYFQKKGKIIFLGIFLPLIKDILQRKGYAYTWMNKLQITLQFIDGRLKNESRKFHLSKIFNAFKQRIKHEKICINKIVNQHQNVFLQQLIYNYKLSIVGQKNSSKFQLVQEMRRKINGFNFLNQIYASLKREKRRVIIEQIVNVNRAKIFLSSLKKHYRLSKYYNNKIQFFSQNRQMNLLRVVFQGMKNTILTQKVNNRIVQQYQRYTNTVKLQIIFDYLKEHTFSSKLLKKRINNASRIRLSSFADTFFYNLRIQTYSQTKKKITQEKVKRQVLIMKRAVRRFVQWRKLNKSLKLMMSINTQVDKQYCLRFKWRYFYMLRTIVLRSRREKELAESIKQKKITTIKRKCFDCLVTRLIMCLVYKQLQHKLSIKLKKIGLTQIKQFYFMKLADAAENSSDEDNQTQNYV